MAHIRFPGFSDPPMETGMVDIRHFRGNNLVPASCAASPKSHPVGIIGPVITGNAFFPIWYHIHGFAGPRELGWSDTLYSFLESDGPVQCNAPTCQGREEERIGGKRTNLDNLKRNGRTVLKIGRA